MMIAELAPYISDDQINTIVNKILEQYSKYKSFTGRKDYKSLFDADYESHRKKHSLSWAILSAFPDKSTIAGSFHIERLVYGGGHTRPVLLSDDLELHILSDTTDFSAKYLEERYKMNKNVHEGKNFCYIKYTEKNDELLSLELILPDSDGKVIARDPLRSSHEIVTYIGFIGTSIKAIK